MPAMFAPRLFSIHPWVHKRLTFASIILTILAGALLPLAAAAAEPAVSRDAAVAIVTEALPGSSLEGVRLFVGSAPMAAGASVASWKREIYVAPAEGWFVFVDLVPEANWEHACRYFFVDAATGELSSFDAMVPPRERDAMVEITSGRDNPPEGLSERMLEQFDEQLRRLPKPEKQSRGMAYAFIISGGADSGNNHIRYWNDCAFIYRTLVNYYGYLDENIFVCISDGTNPAIDRSNGTNSPPDLDGDGDDDIQYPATLTYIDMVFDQLAAQLHENDQLFIFTTDHGGQQSGYDCYLNLWNWEELRDDQMAAYVNALPCASVICTFEQCFSGGMVDDLQGEGHVIATAANWNEYSWAMPPDYVYDTFVYFWTSAVAWATPYGTPVDADTNDDTMVSMYEAFLYAQAEDFSDETPQYSSTPAELGDILNLYGNLEGVYLTREDLIIDDDMSGASWGDGDGVIEFQETIEVYVALHNMGMSGALQVNGVLSTPSTYVSMTNGEVNFGDIPSGETVTNPVPFVFHVAQNVPDGTDLQLTLTVSEEPGDFALGLTAAAPLYEVKLLDIDDSSGNGNGIAEPGETVTLMFQVGNVGSCPSPDLNVILRSGDIYFTTDETPRPIGVIPMGGSIIEPGFSATIDVNCPAVYAGILYVELSAPGQYTAMGTASLPVGRIFADDVEQGAGYWTHYVGPGSGWVDQWHLETYRNHSPGGDTSWKCGGVGDADYANYCYSILETDPFVFTQGGTLYFWHWIEAETSPAYPGYCYDGGLLQISVNGGAWQALTPVGGYPYTIRTGGTQTGPFALGTRVWSGTQDWSEAAVDLSSFSGTIKLRWVFGSDRAIGKEGWYIDDVQVVLHAAMDAPNEEPVVQQILRPRLMPARPNPAAALSATVGGDLVHLCFELPATADVRLDLFDASGRCIRTLAQGSFHSGAYEIPWDGRDGAGQPVGTGSYYYRLVAGKDTQAGKVMVVR